MAGIMSNILSSVNTGLKKHLSDKRATLDEQEDYDLRKSREQESYDLNRSREEDTYNTKKQRNISSEANAYKLKQSRISDRQNKMIEDFKSMYPDLAKDPAIMNDYTANVKGLKIPTQPTNPEVSKAYFSGDTQGAARMAATSRNPSDMQFIRDMMGIEKNKAVLDKYKNLGKQTGGNTNTNSKEYRNSLSLAKKNLDFKKENLERLQYDIENGVYDSDTAKRDRFLKKAKFDYEKANSDYGNLLAGNTSNNQGNSGNIAVTQFNDLMNRFMPRKQ